MDHQGRETCYLLDYLQLSIFFSQNKKQTEELKKREGKRKCYLA